MTTNQLYRCEAWETCKREYPCFHYNPHSRNDMCGCTCDSSAGKADAVCVPVESEKEEPRC